MGTPTNRGVGISSALKNIEIDRYSNKRNTGVSIDFADSSNTFLGWKTASASGFHNI